MTRREAVALLLGSWALSHAGETASFSRAITATGQTTPTDPTSLALGDLVARVRRGDLSPIDVVEAYLRRIGQINPTLNAYVTVTADRATATARRLGIRRGGAGSADLTLLGAPIAHKDLFDTAGVRTAGGSRLYADRVPVQDAALVAILAAAGAVSLGKTNTHELGGGVTTINPFFGTTRNPRDHERVAGGSSGGSAAAVAAGLAAAATGSDTGGSIRIPAAFCGCVGFKPTHGLLGTAGLLGASPTFDHAGFLARSVDDVVLLLRATTSVGPRRRRMNGGPGRSVSTGVRGLRVGVARRFFFDELDADVARAIEAVLGELGAAGAGVRDIELPVDATTMARVFDPIVVSEIRLTYREAWQTSPQAFSKEFASVFEARGPSGDQLAAAHRERRRFQADVAAALEPVDVVLTPTVATAAPRIDGPIDGMRILRNTWPFNAAHAPALTLPCGPRGALPVGLQLAAPPDRDEALLASAAAIAALLA